MSLVNIPKPKIVGSLDPTVMRVVPKLAEEIGLNESIVLLQIAFLIGISNHYIDGQYWTYQSSAELKKEYFPFWSISTINRTTLGLVESNLLNTANYNAAKYDKTRWYSLNIEGLSKLKSIMVVQESNLIDIALCQNDKRLSQDDKRLSQDDKPIPETTTETTSKEKELSPVGDKPPTTVSDEQAPPPIKGKLNTALYEDFLKRIGDAFNAKAEVKMLAHMLLGTAKKAPYADYGQLLKAVGLTDYQMYVAVCLFPSWWAETYGNITTPRKPDAICDFMLGFLEKGKEWRKMNTRPMIRPLGILSELGNAPQAVEDDNPFTPEQLAMIEAVEAQLYEDMLNGQ